MKNSIKKVLFVFRWYGLLTFTIIAAISSFLFSCSKKQSEQIYNSSISCSSKKNIYDIILNKDYLDNHFKFTITTYYNNPNEYYDMPLELGEIKDKRFEIKKERIFYERSFKLFLDTYFPEKLEISNDKELYQLNKATNNSFCEIRNENGELLYWFSLKIDLESDDLIINNLLITNGKPIIEFFLCEVLEAKEEEVANE